MSLALKINGGKFAPIPSMYSAELSRVINLMLQVTPRLPRLVSFPPSPSPLPQ